MYAVYSYVAGATQANVLADIVAILTGTTNPASLSAACDTANTSITATVAAGWTVHDAAFATNKQVIKSAYVDNPSQFKYAVLDHSNSGYLQLFIAEDVNSTTHVATNLSGNAAATAYQPRNGTAAGKFHLWSSARFMAIAAEIPLNFGAVSNGGPTVVAEMSRGLPWNTDSNLMPSVCLIYYGLSQNGSSPSNHAYLTRAQNLYGGDDTGTSAVGFMAYIGVCATGQTDTVRWPVGPNNRARDNNLANSYIPLMPIWITNPRSYGAPLGDISTVSDIWTVPSNLTGHLETFDKSTAKYMSVMGGPSPLYTSDTGVRVVFRGE